MNDLEFARWQLIELKRLLESAEEDPILIPQLLERISDAELRLAECLEAS